jgi:hypothetical protein
MTTSRKSPTDLAVRAGFAEPFSDTQAEWTAAGLRKLADLYFQENGDI